MNASKLFLTLTGASAALAGSSCSGGKKAPDKPLNVVYIMCDDHSYQTVSAYDQRYMRTPNIDRLADEGARFTNSFVANSLSGPSRARHSRRRCTGMNSWSWLKRAACPM